MLVVVAVVNVEPKLVVKAISHRIKHPPPPSRLMSPARRCHTATHPFELRFRYFSNVVSFFVTSLVPRFPDHLFYYV